VDFQKFFSALITGLVIPLAFIFFAVLLEFITNVTKGIGREDQIFRVWFKEITEHSNRKLEDQQEQKGDVITLEHFLTIDMIRDRAKDEERTSRSILHIDKMGSSDIWNYGIPLAIDLIVASLTADVIWLFFKVGQIGRLASGFITGHLFILLSIIFLAMRDEASGPHELVAQRRRSLLAFGLGTIAILTSMGIFVV
jgi:hypothetical protein